MPIVPYRPRHASMPVHRRKRRVAPGIRGPGAKRQKVARTRTRRSVKRKSSDVDGTFVKCKDYKKKRINVKKLKAYRRFSKRVKNIVYGDLPKKVEIQSFSFSVGGSNDIYGTSGPDQCIWFQFALDPLNNWNVSTTNTGHGHAFKLVQSNATALNASGVTQLLYCPTTSAIPTAAVVRGDNPTIGGICADTGNTLEIAGMGPEVVYRINQSHMKYQMKNVAPYGGTLEIFYVKPKRKIEIGPYPAYGGVLTSTTAAGVNALINTKPTAYNSDTTFTYTPLEVANYGLARIANGVTFGQPASHLNASVMHSLAGSRDFNDYFKITGKCKVYIPPGGTMERSVFHKNHRSISTDYLQNHLADSRTTYVVCRWTPEVGVVNTTAGAAPGVLKGDVAGVGAIPYDLVGVVHYRHVVKMCAGASRTRQNMQVWSTVPVAPATSLQPTTTHTLMS